VLAEMIERPKRGHQNGPPAATLDGWLSGTSSLFWRLWRRVVAQSCSPSASGGRVCTAARPWIWSPCGANGPTFLVLVGFVCAAAALQRLPLFLVQSLLAFSIGVTATISAFMGTHLSRTGWVALGIGAAGLILLGLSADPSPARALPAAWRWILLGAAVPVAAIAFYAKRRKRVWAAPALAFGVGLSLSVVGISARALDPPHSVGNLILEPLVWAIVLNGLTAAVVFAMALQKGGPTAVTAIMFTTNTALSSIIGLTYLDDRVRAGFTAPAAVGFVLAVGGAVGVAHYAAVARQKGSSTTPRRDRGAK
jgi:drug/metabolite transporter (DMT)-like permease